VDAKDRLRDKALDLFSRTGYDGCGVQDICDAAGVTKPTLYHHYGSKAGLLEALVDDITRPLITGLRRLPPYAGDLPGTLTELTRLFFSDADRRPREYRYYLALLLAPDGTESRRSVERSDAVITEHITRLFLAAAEQHGNMRGRHQLLTAAYRGMVSTIGALIAEGRLSYTDEVLHRAVHQFSHGIYS